MIKVMRYISQISEKPDLRSANNNVFQLKKILNSKIENFIKHYDIEKISNFDQSENQTEGDSPMEVKQHSTEEMNEEVKDVLVQTPSGKSSKSNLSSDSTNEVEKFLLNYHQKREGLKPETGHVSMTKSRDNTPSRMDNPPEYLVKNSPLKPRASFLKFDGSLSKSFKRKNYTREHSFNES